jgi:hypothetical protein
MAREHILYDGFRTLNNVSTDWYCTIHYIPDTDQKVPRGVGVTL